MRRSILPVLLVLTVLGAACAGGDAGEETTTTTPATTTTTMPATTTTSHAPPTTVPGVTPAIDWDGETTAELGDGWSVRHCEGEAPVLCVARNGEVVGLLEIFIVEPLDYSVYDPEVADEDNLRAIAAQFVETFVEDRAAGCGPDYVVEPIEPRPIEIGGTQGIVHGFRGELADGTPSELNLQYAILSHGRLVIVAASAYDEGGCPGKDDLISFDSETLDGFRPHLEALLAASPLPGGDPETGLALPDGYVFVWIRSMEDGLIVDPAKVLSGEEARLQAVADGVIPEGEDLPNDIYLYNPSEEPIRVRVADEVRWTVIAPGGDGTLAARETDRDTIASILAGGDPGEVYGLTPEFMPFDLLVVGGEVVEVNERYLP